jgi:cytochrome c oxidase subunit IV
VSRQALAGLQFVIAYQPVDGSQMFARMLLIAVAEAGLALMFFMHLGQEKRGLLLFALCDRLHDIRHRGHAIWL